MRRWGRVTVVGVAAAAVVTGTIVLTRPGAPVGPAAGTTGSPSPSMEASPAVPALVRDCWVPDPAGNISLSAEEARALTTVAAKASARSADRRQSRVRKAVDRRLEVTPQQADRVTRSLLGIRSTQRLTCSYVRLSVQPQDPGPSGLTPRARRLRAAWTDVFGPLVAGGFARGGVSSGHVDSSPHYEGRAVDVFFRPLGDPEQRRRGRVFAQWLVAHAQDYHVLSVIYADQIWTSWGSFLGWREYIHPSGDRRNAVLRHLDHVHVAVESGRPYRPS